jgi:beta-xylosidase
MTNTISAPVTVYPWIPDQRDGTFRNPIIAADYSDPDVIRDGDDYFLTASSFNCTPALPILHSRDLVNWTIINHAVHNLPDPRGVYHTPRHGEGVWAPAIRKHAGLYYIFFPMPDEGIYVTTADDPRAQWSEPHLLLEGKGLIDPCPLWDDDGRAYMVHAFANSRCGIKHKLAILEISPDATRVLSDRTIVFDQPDRHPTCEGPKLHKRNNYYYISAPAGGVRTGWQLILRSRNILGPYDQKIVLAQGTTPINGPHQGALVDTPTGEWWFVHFQDDTLYGRITHLQPVRWVDDWPLIGINQSPADTGEPVLHHPKPRTTSPVPIAIPQTSDEFDAPTLGLQWQWHANHSPTWHSLGQRPSHLRLPAIPAPTDFWQTPNLLLQKLPAHTFSASTELHLKGDDPHAEAGLILIGQQHAALVLASTPAGRRIQLRINNEIVEDHPRTSCGGILHLHLAPTGLARFAYTDCNTPTRHFAPTFQATEGKWIGAKLGLFCRTTTPHSNAHADFDYLRFEPPTRSALPPNGGHRLGLAHGCLERFGADAAE